MLNRVLQVQQMPCLQAEAPQLSSWLLWCCSHLWLMLQALEQVRLLLLQQQGCAWIRLQHLQSQLLLQDLQARPLF